jgi:hypothetical protein
LEEDVLFEKNDFTFEMLNALYENGQRGSQNTIQLHTYSKQAIDALISNGI